MLELKIKDNVLRLQERVSNALNGCGRSGDEILIVGVSKTKSVEEIQFAYQAGIKVFGENYAQELLKKCKNFSQTDLKPVFHFVGHLQSNKVKEVIPHIDCLQSLDSLKLANKLNNYLIKENKQGVDSLLQINISKEEQKSGINSENLLGVLEEMGSLTKIRLRGLMGIGSLTNDLNLRAKEFALLRSLRDKAESEGYNLPELSMGMSDDFEVAIKEGATIIRPGSIIFGNRT